jgi:DegV family protein with EDD domain
MVNVITDSTVCLPAGVAERYRITVIPQNIHFNGAAFRDGVDIDVPGFLARLRHCDEIPKTAAPPPKSFVDQFKRLLPGGEPILCIMVSSRLSATVDAARVAAAQFPCADIRVIDTRLAAGPLGTLVTLAAQWGEAGVPAEEIAARVTAMSPRGRLYFLVDDLAYVARSGRVTTAAAWIGSLLQLKPLLRFSDGAIEAHARTRTRRRALEALRQLVVDESPRDASGYVSVMHADAPADAQNMASYLEKRMGLADIPIFDVPSGIVVHAGPGIVGVGFFAA